MPALSLPPELLGTLLSRDAIANVTQNATAGVRPLQVICAWPVSGQYGIGSRYLYYVLVAACVVARKTEWLRKACLAAALLLPAIAALHGIVLAALHRDGAVDMDVFGAFQLCSIGILAAPVTVRLSTTYFFDPARNIIFVWTGLILSGLLSLTVEFYRIKTSDCTQDGLGHPVSPHAQDFPYGEDTTCNLVCSVDAGPFSPMRKGSANNIYVIPAPDKLSFGTATLLAAACCIPAILSMVTMWNKILEINWKTRFGNSEKAQNAHEPIPGTNGATNWKMEGVNTKISQFLSVVEAPVFGGAVLAILIIGERNFFSHQVDYQTEPVASVGQWAPIVGTGLAAIGSLLLLKKPDGDPNATAKTCNCNCSDHVYTADSQSPQRPQVAHVRSPSRSRSPISLAHRSTHRSIVERWNAGNRGTVRETLIKFSNYIGTAAADRFDDSDFKRGRAGAWPEIPAEEQRNDALPDIRKRYNGSRASSVASRGAESNMTPTGPASPQSPDSSRPQIRIASPVRRPHANSFPDKRSPEHRRTFSSSSSTASPLARRATLEVPPLILHQSTRNSLSGASRSSVDTMSGAQSPPTIMLSPDPETAEPLPSPPTELHHSPTSESPPASPR